MKKNVRFVLNGNDVVIKTDPCRPLLHVLREELGLTATKKSCEAGECGACTVLLDGEPVPSCIVPVGKVLGRRVSTVEGLIGDRKFHLLQRAFIDHSAIQCGYCTPGMLLTSLALLEANSNPSEFEIREALSGNLCRCTGYKKIIEAVIAAGKKLRKGGGKACTSNGTL